MIEKEFLSVQEIARHLSISEDTAQKIVGALPHVRAGAPGSRKPRIRVRMDIYYGWLSQQDGYPTVRQPLKAVRGGKA